MYHAIRAHPLTAVIAPIALATGTALALLRGPMVGAPTIAARAAPPLPTVAPTIRLARSSHGHGAPGYYQLQLLSVIVTVDTAENDVAAAVAVVRNGGSLHDARIDVAEAVTNLRLAKHEMAAIHPPAALAKTHQAVERAIAVLIQGGDDILHGIDTLNARERARGIARFNQGLHQLQRAARTLHP